MTTKHSTTKPNPDTDAHAWAREFIARVPVGPVLARRLLDGAIEIVTDDPARRAALRAEIEASDAALPSIAGRLTVLSAAAGVAMNTLDSAARASERGDNDARGDLVRKAREELRAILADDLFALAVELPQCPGRLAVCDARAEGEVSPQ